MRIGVLRIQPRTVKGLYYAAGSFTILAVSVGLCFLIGMMLLPESREIPFR